MAKREFATTEDGLSSVSISMSGDELFQIGGPIIEAINKAQISGHTIDAVLTTLTYVLGSALGQRGIVLDLNAPVSVALYPLMIGYEKARSLFCPRCGMEDMRQAAPAQPANAHKCLNCGFSRPLS